MGTEDDFAGRHLERLGDLPEPDSNPQSNAPPVSMHPHVCQNFGSGEVAVVGRSCLPGSTLRLAATSLHGIMLRNSPEITSVG